MIGFVLSLIRDSKTSDMIEVKVILRKCLASRLEPFVLKTGVRTPSFMQSGVQPILKRH